MNPARIRRKFQRSTLRLSLVLGVFYRRFTVYLRRYRKKLFSASAAVLVVLLASVTGLIFFRNHIPLKQYAEALSTNGTVSQLGIAVGAAMLGVIGIVFSLSIFSIQQVAERGTPLTLREYSNDWVFGVVYWSLAVFTVLAMAAALWKKDSALDSIIANFAILVLAILLLKAYFKRAIQFSDPHFTVSKIAKRARRFLNDIRRIERAAGAEFRYARRRAKP